MSSGALAVLRGVVTACEAASHVLGHIYPAYQTFKAIQRDEVSGYVPWVTFWIVNSFFTMFEVIGGKFLSAKLPVYYPLKLLLVAWLVLPQFHGASTIYDRLIAPYLLRYEEDIDRKVEELQQKSGEAAGEIAGAGLRAGAGVVKLGVKQVAKEVKQQVLQDPTVLLQLLEESDEDEEPTGKGKAKKKAKDKDKAKEKAKAKAKEKAKEKEKEKEKKGRSKKKKS